MVPGVSMRGSAHERRGVVMVVLKDGSQLPKDLYRGIFFNLKQLMSKTEAAAVHLMKKCEDPRYIVGGNAVGISRSILQQYGLMDLRGDVPENVKKVVLNAVEFRQCPSTLRLIDPRRVSA